MHLSLAYPGKRENGANYKAKEKYKNLEINGKTNALCQFTLHLKSFLTHATCQPSNRACNKVTRTLGSDVICHQIDEIAIIRKLNNKYKKAC